MKISPELIRRRLEREIPMYDIRDLAEYNRQLRLNIDAIKADRRRWIVVNPDTDAC
jgi:hypothetical protein